MPKLTLMNNFHFYQSEKILSIIKVFSKINVSRNQMGKALVPMVLKMIQEIVHCRINLHNKNLDNKSY